jgi:sn-glycerol 3-phosphate transport system ATP-binding protein
MATISLQDIRKTYQGGVEAVKGVSLDIADGELVVLVGPSGCGKSTLLRMVAGLERITSGTLRIGERVVNDLEPAERDIAMVFQNYALYPHMTVRGNLAYGLKNRGFGRADIEARVKTAAEMLEIAAYLDRKPRQLSGGQRQRVAIARALLKNAPILVLDEATSALDTESELLVQEALANLLMNRTSFVIAHRLSTIRRADAIVVLEHGRVVEIGRHEELLANPEGTYATLYQLQLLEGRRAERRMVPS